MIILEYIRSWNSIGKENHIDYSFIVSVLKEDIRDSFQNIEVKAYYKNFGKVALLIGEDFNLVVITKKRKLLRFVAMI